MKSKTPWDTERVRAFRISHGWVTIMMAAFNVLSKVAKLQR